MNYITLHISPYHYWDSCHLMIRPKSPKTRRPYEFNYSGCRDTGSKARAKIYVLDQSFLRTLTTRRSSVSYGIAIHRARYVLETSSSSRLSTQKSSPCQFRIARASVAHDTHVSNPRSWGQGEWDGGDWEVWWKRFGWYYGEGAIRW